jgi:hypothetical protein
MDQDLLIGYQAPFCRKYPCWRIIYANVCITGLILIFLSADSCTFARAIVMKCTKYPVVLYPGQTAQ